MHQPSKFWDKHAERYSKSPVADEESYQKKLQVTREYLQPDMEVLEFGCGTGTQEGKVALTGETIGGKTLTGIFFGSSAINDSGEVAFWASYPGGGEGIFTQHGKIALEGETIGGQELIAFGQFPSISNSGEVAFIGFFRDETNLIRRGIFTQSGAVALPGLEIDGKKLVNFDHIGSPSINNLAEVAFRATFAGGEGIFTSSNRVIAVTGKDYGGKILTEFGLGGVLDINGEGDVVFPAMFSDGGSVKAGIFTQSVAIAVTGQEFDGKILTDLGGVPVINKLENSRL